MNKTEKYVKGSLGSSLSEVMQNPDIRSVQNGLSLFEKALIYDYTKDGYKTIN
jgi:hypothetical protein